ncbi:MAG: hypothetical protein ACK4HV_04545 [Parachlamydiaceae bacterium]
MNGVVTEDVSENIALQWGLEGGWCGGRLNPTLDIVRFKYVSDQSLEKDDIRKLYIEVIEYMLYAYNSNEKLRCSFGEFPFKNKNLQIKIKFPANDCKVGKIKYVAGFEDRVIFSYVTDDMSYKRDSETFDEAYFKVYGKAWDPYRYGRYEIKQ